MTLDATAKEANVKDSIKKYFVDNIFRTKKIPLTFDKFLNVPKIQSREVDKWVNINWGPIEMDTLSSIKLDIFCCTRKDSEGFKLAHVRDTVFEFLTDNTQTHGMRMIPFYRSRQNEAWTKLQAMLITKPIIESQQIDAKDGTKYKILTCTLKWGAKV